MRAAFSVAALRLALPVFNLKQPIGSALNHAFVLQQYWRHYHLDDLMQQSDYYFGLHPVLSYQICVQVWKPSQPRATLWVLHGYFDHVGLFHHLIRWALTQELAVVAFDLPGHGLSSGPPAVIDDFAEYRHTLHALLAEFADQLPQPALAAGQSTGGAILIDALLNPPFVPDQSPWQQVVLLAPLVHPVGWRSVNVSYRLMKPFSEFVPRSFNGYTNDPDFLPFLEHNEPLQAKVISARWVGAMITWANHLALLSPSSASPCIIQGDCDQTVDYPFNISLLQTKFAHPEIHMLSGAHHHLVNESDEFRQKIFAIMYQAYGLNNL